MSGKIGRKLAAAVLLLAVSLTPTGQRLPSGERRGSRSPLPRRSVRPTGRRFPTTSVPIRTGRTAHRCSPTRSSRSVSEHPLPSRSAIRYCSSEDATDYADAARSPGPGVRGASELGAARRQPAELPDLEPSRSCGQPDALCRGPVPRLRAPPERNPQPVHRRVRQWGTHGSAARRSAGVRGRDIPGRSGCRRASGRRARLLRPGHPGRHGSHGEPRSVQLPGDR